MTDPDHERARETAGWLLDPDDCTSPLQRADFANLARCYLGRHPAPVEGDEEAARECYRRRYDADPLDGDAQELKLMAFCIAHGREQGEAERERLDREAEVLAGQVGKLDAERVALREALAGAREEFASYAAAWEDEHPGTRCHAHAWADRIAALLSPGEDKTND